MARKTIRTTMPRIDHLANAVKASQDLTCSLMSISSRPSGDSPCAAILCPVFQRARLLQVPLRARRVKKPLVRDAARGGQMLPIGQQGSESGDERRLLVQHDMMLGLRNLDHRSRAAQEVE